jgi:hypothetical protein
MLDKDPGILIDTHRPEADNIRGQVRWRRHLGVDRRSNSMDEARLITLATFVSVMADNKCRFQLQSAPHVLTPKYPVNVLTLAPSLVVCRGLQRTLGRKAARHNYGRADATRNPAVEALVQAADGAQRALLGRAQLSALSSQLFPRIMLTETT